jgi:hypothetical protein
MDLERLVSRFLRKRVGLELLRARLLPEPAFSDPCQRIGGGR